MGPYGALGSKYRHTPCDSIRENFETDRVKDRKKGDGSKIPNVLQGTLRGKEEFSRFQRCSRRREVGQKPLELEISFNSET